MKKLLFLLIIVTPLLFSCKSEPGTIQGTVTYFFNDHQGYKPDIGADVYITTLACDSLRYALSAASSKKILDDNSSLEERYKALLEDENFTLSDDKREEFSKMVESLEESGKPFAEELKELSDSYGGYENLMNGGKNQLFAIKYDLENTTSKAAVDGIGNYTATIPAGTYNVIIISKGRRSSNDMESIGCINVKQVTIKSKETTSHNVQFNLR